MSQVEQIQSLVARLTESLNEKQKFIDDLQEKLSRFDDNNGGGTQSLQQKLSDLQNSMNTITEKRTSMTNAIADIKYNISQQKQEELSILQMIHETEAEHESEMMSTLTDGLSKLKQKRSENENELLLKDAQLNALISEQKQRDESDLSNLSKLLERATVLERELNDSYYYDTADKLRIYHSHNEVNEMKEVREEMIAKRRQKFDDEQRMTEEEMNRLKESEQKIQQDLLSVTQKREDFEKQILTLNQSEIVKLELEDKESMFSDDDVHRSSNLEYQSKTAPSPESIVQIANLDIHKIEAKIKRLERDLDHSYKRHKQSQTRWQQVKRHSLPNRYGDPVLFQSMKEFLMKQIVDPFCDRYMVSPAELKQIQLEIEQEELGIEQDFKAMMRKRRGHELETIFGDIQKELMEETIQDMILQSFSHLMAINSFAKRLTHKLFLNAVGQNEADESRTSVTHNCLRQLILDRQKHHKRFCLRHETVVIKLPQKEKKEKDEKEGNVSPKRKRRGWFGRKSKSDTDSDLDHSSTSVSMTSISQSEEIDVMERKKANYERLGEHDGVQILFLSQNAEVPFSSQKWMDKEKKYFKEHIELSSGKNKLTKDVTYSTAYTAVVASSDSRFFVIGTDKGEILMFHIASKEIVAKTPEDTKSYGAIKQLLISDNNKEIVALTDSGTVCAYKLEHDTLINILTLCPEDIYAPETQWKKYQNIGAREIADYRPVFVAFHPCTMINGMRPCILITLQNGSVVKWNIIPTGKDNQRILNGHCQTVDEGFFTKFSNISSGNRKWVTREYFQCHSSSVVFLGGVGGCSPSFISMESNGMICEWYYDKQYWKDFGWFVPRQKYIIDLDSFQKTIHNESNQPSTKTLYDVANAMVDAEKYAQLVQGHFAQTHLLWKYQKRKNGNLVEHLYLPKSINSEDRRYEMKSEPFTLDILVFSTSDDSLFRHIQQKWIQRRLKGKLLSAKMCRNHRDLILCIELTPYESNDDDGDKVIQFRMLRLNQRKESADALSVSVDPFMVNIKQNGDSKVVYDISSVLVPPCSDYLYVLMDGSLSVYSIYTSQKLVSTNRSSMAAPFCISPNHSACLFANENTENQSKNPCFWINKIIDRNEMAMSSTFANAVCLRKCSRVSRTDFQSRVQKRAFLDVHGHHPKIFRKIILNLVDHIAKND